MKGGYQENVGNWIRSERTTLHLTQVKLAKLLGVSDSSVSNWERGKFSMTAEAHAQVTYIFKRRRREMNLVEKAAR